MNKKLLTLAVGAALSAAPMIAAQAAVTVYGTAHLSVDSLDNGNATDNSILTLSSNSSYLGFKADEDLGDGMKAIFGAEFQLGLDQATSSGTSTSTARGLLNRNVFVGLQGGFGTLRLGQYDDIMKQIGRKVDLFYNEQLGESRTLTHQGNWDARLTNSVNYETPKFGDFSITFNYGMENTTTDASKVTQYALGLVYSAGPLYAAVAYKNIDQSAVVPVVESPTAIRASLSYTLGDLQITGLYQTASNMGGVSGADNDTYGIGLGYTMGGKHRIKGQYYDTGATNVAGTNGASAYAIGYDYLMSKTTVLYVTYAAVENDTAGTYSVISSGHANPQDASYGATTAGNDPTGISLGMRMSF